MGMSQNYGVEVVKLICRQCGEMGQNVCAFHADATINENACGADFEKSGAGPDFMTAAEKRDIHTSGMIARSERANDCGD